MKSSLGIYYRNSKPAGH